MNNSTFNVLTLALVLGTGAAATGGDGGDADYVVSQAIVWLEDDRHTIEEILADYPGTSVIAEIDGAPIYLVQLPEGSTEQTFEDTLDEDDRCDAELNHLGEAPEGQTQSFFVAVPEGTYLGQYAWDLVGLGSAHLVSTGESVVVALLDSGADASHPVLAGRLLLELGYNFVDGNADVSDVGNGLDDDQDGLIDEMVGHGTFMAGIVAAMAPGAGLLPLRVLDGEGHTNAFFVAQAIYHAVEHGARVINVSMGAPVENEVLEDAVAFARQQGALVVAAAGNLGEETALVPADHPDAVGVAATDALDIKSTFSNYGEHISICAPGTEVASTVPGGGYAQWDGTSLSTAVVSGAAALVFGVVPCASVEQVEGALFQAAWPIDDVNDPYLAGKLGWGRLDAASAVADLVVGDLTLDGAVDVEDLVLVVAHWGSCQAGPCCPGDADGDGEVNVADLTLVLLNWG